MANKEILPECLPNVWYGSVFHSLLRQTHESRVR